MSSFRKKCYIHRIYFLAGAEVGGGEGHRVSCVALAVTGLYVAQDSFKLREILLTMLGLKVFPTTPSLHSTYITIKKSKDDR